MPHKTYIVVIGGWTQGIDRWNGCMRLWSKLLVLRSPTVSVEFLKWDSRFADVAERIFLETEGENVRIIVLPYSYGGGWGMPRFAHELNLRGLDIDIAITCDAVYRSKWAIGKVLAFMDWPVIRLPSNVRQVYPFIQRMSRPRGHRIVAMDTSATRIEEPVVLRADHRWMDDHKEWHRFAIDIVTKAVSKSPIEEAVAKHAISQQEIKLETKQAESALESKADNATARS